MEQPSRADGSEKSKVQLSWHGEVNEANYDDMVKYNSQFRQQRVDELALIVNILKEAGVCFWLDCGSLLGAYRNGKMMPHDNDTDVSILGDEDFDKARQALLKNLPEEYSMKDGTSYADKLEVNHDPSGSFKFSEDVCTSNVSCDLNKYAFREDGTLQQLYHKFGLGERRYEKDWVFPLGEIEFEGLKLPCPRNVKLYLEEMYGYLGTDFKFDPVSTRFVKRDSDE